MGEERDRLVESLYAQAGVDTAQAGVALGGLLEYVRGSFAFRPEGPGSVVLDVGYFANVVRLTEDVGLAVSTDGVGTKILVAQRLEKFDTIGIDCVAMNVNDVLCVGAEPLCLLNYLAVQYADEYLLREVGKGLAEGARQARVTLPGGELAQVWEMVRADREGYGFDLVGTAIGRVELSRVIVGAEVTDGDTVVGLASSGLHSNGYTLARRVLLKEAGLKLEEHVAELGRTLGEELLEPTRIYVGVVREILRQGLRVKAMAHITGDGLFNLLRTAAAVGYFIYYLPEPPAIFRLIQEAGKISDAEMYQVFNMGIGFCLVLPDEDALVALCIARECGVPAWKIGTAVTDPQRKLIIQPKGLVGRDGRFVRL